MNKITKIVFSLASVVLLAGCTSGTKVDINKFQEAVNKIEEHTYSSAMVSYRIDIKGTGSYEDQTENKTGKIEFENKNGSWITDSSDDRVEECRSLLHSIYGRTIINYESSEKDDLKQSFSYYINPLKITQNISGTKTTEKYVYKMNNSYATTYDKYGYIIKEVSKYNESFDGEADLVIITASGSYTLKGTKTFTVSYK